MKSLPLFRPDARRNPVLPFPRGWYALVDSHELKVGDVLTRTAFGRELVVFRTEDGEAHVVDAYCPHLGAHLGHGGTVCGGELRCPFHGWQFEGRSGKCTSLANGDPVPPKAKLDRWPSCEHNGLVLVWFHERGEAPSYTVDLGDFGDGWSEWTTTSWDLRARVQDVGENDADITHSFALHGFTVQVPSVQMRTEGPSCFWELDMAVAREAFGLPRLPRLYDALRLPAEIMGRARVHRCGFSLGLIHYSAMLPGGIELHAQSLCTSIPIDDDHVRLVARHRVARTPLRPLTRVLQAYYAGLFTKTLEEDIPIWENKIYRMRPVASKSDWAILKFRRWAKQFYAEGVYEAAIDREQGSARPRSRSSEVRSFVPVAEPVG